MKLNCLNLLILFVFSILIFSSFKADAQSKNFTFHFATNSNLVSEDEMQRAAQLLHSKRVDSIRLEGHCDSRGSDVFNQHLSELRVKSIANWLELQKLPVETPLTTGAFGERNPPATNMTASGMQENRVVTMLLFYDAASVSPERGEKEKNQEKPTSETADLVQKISTQSTIRLENIKFEGGRDVFLRESFAELKLLLDVMQQRDSLEIEIQGHICCMPSDAEDGMNLATGKMQLSYDRAVAVMNYLLRNGVDQRRMRVVGKGASSPAVWPEVTESDKSQNRRVEIKVLKK
jgi:outer membrane protein OmpA-like peptidoglycan-associated protein